MSDDLFPTKTDIPSFEGEPVVGTKAKVTSVTGLDIADRVFSIDQSVKLLLEVRCQGVDHKPNTEGHLERYHNFKAMECVVVDWDMDMDTLREALA